MSDTHALFACQVHMQLSHLGLAMLGEQSGSAVMAGRVAEPLPQKAEPSGLQVVGDAYRVLPQET